MDAQPATSAAVASDDACTITCYALSAGQISVTWSRGVPFFGGLLVEQWF